MLRKHSRMNVGRLFSFPVNSSPLLGIALFSCGNTILPVFTPSPPPPFLTRWAWNEYEEGCEDFRTEWEGGWDKHCWFWMKMKMKASRSPFHLERNVLVFGSISHLYLMMKVLSGWGTSGNCNSLLGTSFEPLILLYITALHIFTMLFLLWQHGKSFQYHTPLLTCFSSHNSLHSIYKIVVYKIGFITG